MKYYEIMKDSPLRSHVLPGPSTKSNVIDLNDHVSRGLTLPVLVELEYDDCLNGLRFKAGDILVVDREAQPIAGSVVVCDRDGHHGIELFEPKDAKKRKGLFAVEPGHSSVVGVVRSAIVSVCSERAVDRAK